MSSSLTLPYLSGRRATHAAPRRLPSGHPHSCSGAQPPATATQQHHQRPAMNRRLGIIAILISATAMGAAGVFGRFSTPEGAVIGDALTLGRMLTGAVGMGVLLGVRRRLGLLRSTGLSWSVVLGGVFLGLALATYLSATVLTSLSMAVVLHLLGPALATIMARIILKERVSRAAGISLLASVAGMVLAAGPASPVAGSGEAVVGVVLGAASGVLYGAALLCYRFRADMASDVRSFWNFAFGSLSAGAVVIFTRPDLSAMSGANWAWAIAFFLICGLLALGLLVVAGANLRSAELSALSYVEVTVAVVLGAVVFGESLSAASLAGMVLIAVGSVVPFLVRRA